MMEKKKYKNKNKPSFSEMIGIILLTICSLFLFFLIIAFENYGIWIYELYGVLFFLSLISLYCIGLILLYLKRKDSQARFKKNMEKKDPILDSPINIWAISFVIGIIVLSLIIFIPLSWIICGPFVSVLLIGSILFMVSLTAMSKLWCKKNKFSNTYFKSTNNYQMYFITWTLILILILYYTLTFDTNFAGKMDNFFSGLTLLVLSFFIPLTIILLNSYFVHLEIKKEELFKNQYLKKGF